MRCYYEERKILAELAELDSAALIAASPEAALTEESISIIQAIGHIIHIKRSKELILDTLKNDGKHKLVMRNEDGGEEIPMEERAVELYAQELWQYEELADYVFENNGSVEEGLDKLVNLINDIGGVQ
jgi:shikimate kinase